MRQKVKRIDLSCFTTSQLHVAKNSQQEVSASVPELNAETIWT